MSKSKDYIEQIDANAERRFVTAPVTVEKRDEDNENKRFFEIEGYAFKFNTRADLGFFEEEILPEVRDDERLLDDIRCLFNHNPNYVLARSNKGEGTLDLSWDDIGLKYKYTTPNRSYALDLQDAIASGDVSQSSFAFATREDRWVKRDNDKELRQITKFKRFYDVAPVTYPAYQDATVGKRSLERFREKNNEDSQDKENEQRARLTLKDAQCLIYNY